MILSVPIQFLATVHKFLMPVSEYFKYWPLTRLSGTGEWLMPHLGCIQIYSEKLQAHTSLVFLLDQLELIFFTTNAPGLPWFENSALSSLELISERSRYRSSQTVLNGRGHSIPLFHSPVCQICQVTLISRVTMVRPTFWPANPHSLAKNLY